MPPAPRPPKDRLLARIQKTPDGCWTWTGSRNDDGYGRFALSTGVIRYAHRVAYELLVGPIPTGMTIDHLCRDRACVNPAHLEPVTLTDNIRRSPRCLKGRQPRSQYRRTPPKPKAARPPKPAPVTVENTDGLPGIYRQRNGNWTARAKRNGKRHMLGTYPTPAEAHAAYVAWKAQP